MSRAGLMLSALKKTVNRGLRQHAYNFIDLETPVSKSVLMTKKGSLLTVFHYKGLNNIPGREEVTHALDKLNDMFDHLFSSSGQTVQMVNHVDEELTEQEIEAALKNSRKTAERFRLDIQDVFDSNKRELVKYTVYDKTFFAVWTHITSFNPTELSQIQSDHNKKIIEHSKQKKINAPLKDAVRTDNFKMDLFDKHQGVVQLVSNTFDQMGASFEVLSAREAAIKLKSQIEPEVTPQNAAVVLLGDKYTPRSQNGNSSDEEKDDILFPKLDRQLTKLAHYPVLENGAIYQVGNTYYYSMYVDFYPKKFKLLSQLKKAIPSGVQYRLSFLLNSGKSTRHAINAMFHSFVAFGSPENKYIKTAFDKTKEREGTRIKLQMQVVTSAASIEKLKKNRQYLIAAFAEWGSTSLALDVADPKETYISSAIGASPKSPVEAGHPYVDEASFISPLFDPTSQWDSGSILFRSEHGKLIPFQPASSLQESAATGIVAQPRSGKSVFANAMLLSLAVQSGLVRFPRIAAFDIGGSTEGAIDIIRDGLPEDQKYLAKNIKMESTPEYSKNIFDLQLGAKRPLPIERSQIHAFIMLVISESGEPAKEGMSDLVALAIEAAYEFVESENGNRVYTPGAAPILDDLIKKHDIEVIPNETELLAVRDEFFELGLYREAEIAQAYYVPTLTELPEIINQSDKLVREYGADSSFGDLVGRLSSKIRGALRQFPNLSCATQLDLAGARIISIDLTNVTDGESGDGSASKKTSVMYSIAAYAAANDYFLDLAQVPYFEKRYRAYQEKRIGEIAEDLKVIQMDEFHRPAKSPQALAMVEKYLLEGPKYKVAVTLISQKVVHFKNLLRICTNLFFLGKPDNQEVEHINDVIKLTESERDVLENKSHGPGPGGSAMLHWMNTNKGKFSQLVKFPVGPVGLWGLGTSGDDRVIRRKIAARFGGRKSREILARYYPDASIKAEIDRLKDLGMVGDDGKSVVEVIFDRLIAQMDNDGLLND